MQILNIFGIVVKCSTMCIIVKSLLLVLLMLNVAMIVKRIFKIYRIFKRSSKLIDEM